MRKTYYKSLGRAKVLFSISWLLSFCSGFVYTAYYRDWLVFFASFLTASSILIIEGRLFHGIDPYYVVFEKSFANELRERPGSRLVKLPVWFLLGGMLCVFLIYRGLETRRLAPDLRYEEVQAVEGTVDVSRKVGDWARNSISYAESVDMQKEPLMLKAIGCCVLNRGDQVEVYFDPEMPSRAGVVGMETWRGSDIMLGYPLVVFVTIGWLRWREKKFRREFMSSDWARSTR